MKFVVFDTETTGLPVRAADDAPEQPWPVQFGAVVYEDFQLVKSINVLVRPPQSAVFNPSAVKVHGITRELVDHKGRFIDDVLDEFGELISGQDVIAAYNLPFDERIMRTAALRRGKPWDIPAPTMRVCVMRQAEQHFGYRQKLGQVYAKLLGKPLQDAHDAYVDSLAAAEVFMHILAKSLEEDDPDTQ